MKKCEMNESCDEIDVAVKKTEARECETPSKTFRGLCI